MLIHVHVHVLHTCTCYSYQCTHQNSTFVQSIVCIVHACIDMPSPLPLTERLWQGRAGVSEIQDSLWCSQRWGKIISVVFRSSQPVTGPQYHPVCSAQPHEIALLTCIHSFYNNSTITVVVCVHKLMHTCTHIAQGMSAQYPFSRLISLMWVWEESKYMWYTCTVSHVHVYHM